ncbi:unnamed protein product [Parnassius apollo]|uniref:(apollo) hypothetical protein n=1 Tax=Parnassius apollo TaxID=110799 RepID=A0A8S3XSH4_PARAO|nr:unnamed protein product [Parnassius apollo]
MTRQISPMIQGVEKFITKRGTRYPERVMHHTKASVSLMIAGSADGQILPPYVGYTKHKIYIIHGFLTSLKVQDAIQVLSRIPTQSNNSSRQREAVDESVGTLLNDMRYGNMGVKELKRKRKLDVVAGKSVSESTEDYVDSEVTQGFGPCVDIKTTKKNKITR